MTKPILLLVDDDRLALTALRRSLQSADYRILDTTDPADAVRILTIEPVDVIVSDVEMPGMTGLELMEIARHVRPLAVRMLVTGVATLEAATRAINEGEVHRFVHKPYDPTILRGIVEDALARQAELAAASEASRHIDRRAMLRDRLEGEHPGITTVTRDADGAHVIDEARARNIAPSIGLAELLR